MIGVPATLFNWWRKYGRIESMDVDFKTAKRNWKIACWLWAPTPLVVIGFVVIFAVRS
jgi:hypothetical protein